MARHTWRIVLQELPDEGRAWDVAVPVEDLEDTARGNVEALSGLMEDMRWQGEIRRRGEVWRLVGHWQVRMQRHCDRCLAPFAWEVGGELERDYRMEGIAENEDEEVLAYPGEVDLIDVLREEVWLAWRVRTVCREDCRGLCPHCGADLNEGACNCAQKTEDSPFAVLRALKLG